MLYRELNSEDFKSYFQLRDLALEDISKAFISTNKEEKIVRKEKFESLILDPINFILGVFDNDQLIGVISFSREKRLRVKHKGGIFGMFVKPSHQGRGFGLRLLEMALEKSFKIDGIRQINLGVFSSNEKAINLYKKVGFEVYGLEKDAVCIDGRFYDEYLMTKFKETDDT